MAICYMYGYICGYIYVIYIYVSFIVYIKTDDIYKYILKEVETRFNTSKKTITKNL